MISKPGTLLALEFSKTLVQDRRPNEKLIFFTLILYVSKKVSLVVTAQKPRRLPVETPLLFPVPDKSLKFQVIMLNFFKGRLNKASFVDVKKR